MIDLSYQCIKIEDSIRKHFVRSPMQVASFLIVVKFAIFRLFRGSVLKQIVRTPWRRF